MGQYYFNDFLCHCMQLLIQFTAPGEGVFAICIVKQWDGRRRSV